MNELSLHPPGAAPTPPESDCCALVAGDRPVAVDTIGGRVDVKWDPAGAVTPLGQLPPLFANVLKVSAQSHAWVEARPGGWRSINTPIQHARQSHPPHRQGAGQGQDRLHDFELQPDALSAAHEPPSCCARARATKDEAAVDHPDHSLCSICQLGGPPATSSAQRQPAVLLGRRWTLRGCGRRTLSCWPWSSSCANA